MRVRVDGPRGELEMRQVNADVPDPHARHTGWWQVLVAFAIVAAVAGTVYYLTAPRLYSGKVEWLSSANPRTLRLGPSGPIVSLDEPGPVTVDGADAMLPAGPVPAYLGRMGATVSWIPYLFQRNGVSGEVTALDLER
jgi:hypothetical protein